MLLEGDGLSLLRACCNENFDQLGAGGRRLAAASWIRQTFPRPIVPAEETFDDDELDSYVVPSSVVMAGLVDAGHSIQDILSNRQYGFDGEPMPYPGWTLPQFEFWTGAVQTLRRHERATTIESLVTAIAGALDADAYTLMREEVRELRRLKD